MSDFELKIKSINDKILQNLENAEQIALEKIEEKDLNPKIFNFENPNLANLQAKIIEQDAIIQNLNQELNEAQILIKELGKENDFLKEKNNNFSKKIFDIQTKGAKLSQMIEDDFEKIKIIIKNGNN